MTIIYDVGAKQGIFVFCVRIRTAGGCFCASEFGPGSDQLFQLERTDFSGNYYFGAATFGVMVILSLSTYVQFKQRLALQKGKQHQSELEAEISILKTRLERELTKDITKNDL